MTTLVAPDVERFPVSAADRALALEHGLEVVELEGHETADFARVAASASALLAWGGWYGRETFDAMPGLRVIARCGAGFDNIDLGEAAARGIVVTYCPGLFDDVVAEHAIASMLAVARKIPSSDAAIRAGQWPSSRDLAPLGRISGTTLGLVGFGRIARRVAALALGLEMRVVVFDPYLRTLDVPGVERVDTLREVLTVADVLSLHTPLTTETRGILGRREFALMKPSAILVNTARGELIDNEALAGALADGVLGGAALDVFDPEPIPAGHPILAAPNVLVTPHSSAFEDQALALARFQAISDAVAVLEGRAPRYPIPAEEAAR